MTTITITTTKGTKTTQTYENTATALENYDWYVKEAKMLGIYKIEINTPRYYQACTMGA